VAQSPYCVVAGQKVKLSKWSTDDTGPFREKADAKESTKTNIKRLIELQSLLYASASHSILIVLQAMDAGGKDGAISHVFGGVNPQGCNVTSFKVPSHLELSHDYLWRYHQACPEKGMIGIFNRSHYESVLVERVRKIVPKEVWSRRYKQISQWEQMLISEKTVILKFFLHISRQEQKKRLEDRLQDKSKNWKLDASDIGERKHWDAYTEAFEEMLEKCSTEEAPWYVVPADHKWFRNWVISGTIVQTMQKLNMKYPKGPKGLEKRRIK
jgi:PPK2 family polyphosphate:nucleotide phosphotransferase